MTAKIPQGALAGFPSNGTGNRSTVGDVTRTACPGDGRMAGIPHTWSEPVVGA